MNNKITSAHKVKEFYDQVIEDFGKRLILRFDGREQGVDSQIIDQLKKKLRQEIFRSKTNLFNAALQTKHYSSTSLIRHASRNSSGRGEIVKKQQNDDKQKIQEDNDYLQLFNDPGAQVNKIQEEDIVKKQELSPEQPVKIEENGHNEIEDERDDQQDREKQRQTQILKNSLLMHIVGTYQPKSKKHIAKDQSTKIELDDVFIQYKQPNEEIYCHKLICEFKKD